MISIVIPTISGREDHLERCVASYENNTKSEYELIIIENRPTCGIAWNDGASLANGKYIHLSADDLEPSPNWDRYAIEAVDRDFIPHPQVFRVDGSLDDRYGPNTLDWQEVYMSTIPFMTMNMWSSVGPSLDLHYYTDDWISWKASMVGYKCVVRKGYRFIHHIAQHGRGAGMPEIERLNYDRAEFDREKMKFVEMIGRQA